MTLINVPGTKIGGSNTRINITGKFLDPEDSLWRCKDWEHNCSDVSAIVEKVVLKRV